MSVCRFPGLVDQPPQTWLQTLSATPGPATIASAPPFSAPADAPAPATDPANAPASALADAPASDAESEGTKPYVDAFEVGSEAGPDESGVDPPWTS